MHDRGREMRCAVREEAGAITASARGLAPAPVRRGRPARACTASASAGGGREVTEELKKRI